MALLCGALSACGAGSDRRSPVPPASVVHTHPGFYDSHPHDGVGDVPRRYPVHGIDVSRWQGAVDWDRARAAGVTFAYMKATEGGDLRDPMFTTYRDGARRAGVRYGAYHYFYFCRPAAEQAQWFIGNVPKDPGALPAVLDMEWNHRSPTCTRRPTGTEVRAEAMIFLDILERHYGRRPLVYTTVDFFQETGIGQLPRTEFWLRSVAAHPREVYPGMLWSFWQYTGTGIVPGIDRPVDINVFAGSLEQWRTWAR
ncbi:hypothetical protein P775_28460 [Puniceibacterium antarcticum]|uniref:Lysozyme n=2 Tax=Puniceibacterium antarcticum TaxID=1206336 RepID=A0A2G8QT15_9RHOB|nr:hypothetical protein P775_28460 [Puniceibacterium antarcticum]